MPYDTIIPSRYSERPALGLATLGVLVTMLLAGCFSDDPAKPLPSEDDAAPTTPPDCGTDFRCHYKACEPDGAWYCRYPGCAAAEKKEELAPLERVEVHGFNNDSRSFLLPPQFMCALIEFRFDGVAFSGPPTTPAQTGARAAHNGTVVAQCGFNQPLPATQICTMRNGLFPGSIEVQWQVVGQGTITYQAFGLVYVEDPQ